MTGDDHAVYGRSMGNTAWIFIDADGVPWRAELVWTSSLLTVTLHRFGLLNTPPDEVTYSASVGFSPPSLAGLRSSVDDVDSSGRQVAFVLYLSNAGGSREVQAVYLISLSGAGASVSVDVSDETPDPLVAGGNEAFPDNVPGNYWYLDVEEVEHGPLTTSELGDLLGSEWSGRIGITKWPPRTHYWQRYRRVIGATLIEDEFRLVFHTVYIEVSGVSQVEGDVFDWDNFNFSSNRHEPLCHVEWVITGTLTITLNGIDTEVPSHWSSSGSTQGGASVGEWSVTPVTINGHAEPAPYSTWFYGDNWGTGVVRGSRVSNRCYASFRYVCGPHASEFSSTQEEIQYATANPVSGDMVTGPTPVCFV